MRNEKASSNRTSSDPVPHGRTEDAPATVNFGVGRGIRVPGQRCVFFLLDERYYGRCSEEGVDPLCRKGGIVFAWCAQGFGYELNRCV